MDQILDFIELHNLSTNKIINAMIIGVALLLVFYYLYTIYDAVKDMIAHAEPEEKRSQAVLEKKEKTERKESDKDAQVRSPGEGDE